MSFTRRPFSHRAEWLIFFVLLACYAYILPRWADWNVNSRMDVAFAVVDQGTLSIDAYHSNTGDYAFFEGHYYSDKAPGTSFLGILLYAPYKALGGNALAERLADRLGSHSALLTSLDPNGKGMVKESLTFFAALYFVTFFGLMLPSAFLGVLLFRLLLTWAVRTTDALVLTLAYGLATPAFAYANNLYGHQLAAFLLLAAFYCVFRGAQNRHRKLYPALAGLALGFVVITEYPTVLVAGAIALYAIYRLRNWRSLALMALATLPPMLAAASYNYAIFHTPLPVGYLYSTLYTNLHHTGLVSLTYPKLDILLQLAFGAQRGLLLLAPFLALALPGFLLFAIQRKWRAEFLLCVWAVVCFWLFNGSSEMWQGGFAVGPRYLVPMLPFMTLPIIFVANWVRGVWRFALYALYLVSFVLVWIQSLGGQQFPQNQINPLLEYSFAQIRAGNVARNLGMALGLHDLATLLPLAILILLFTLGYLWLERRAQTRLTSAANESHAALPYPRV